MGFFKKLSDLILGRNAKRRDKKKIISKTTFRGECEICFKRIDQFDGFCCKYCLLWHCSEHMLPEDHQCTGNVTNPHAFG